MIEWYWVATIASGSFAFGFLVGIIRAFFVYRKKIERWMHNEDIINRA